MICIKTPLFSIIAPVYNTEKYLDDCIQSVINQGFDDYELILVNDGSTDGSGEICDKYSASCERIKVIHKKNGGLVSARKCGAEAACGEYALVLDSDDFLCEGSLLKLSKIISEHRPDIISFDFIFFWTNTKKEWTSCFSSGYYHGEELCLLKEKMLYFDSEKFYTFGISPAIWSKAIKMSLYKKYQKNLDDRIKMGEDVAVTFPLFMDAQSIYISKDKNVYYRQLDNSISHSFRTNDLEDLEMLLRYLDNAIDYSKFNAESQIAAYTLDRVINFISSAISCADSYSEYFGYATRLNKFILSKMKDFRTLSWKTNLLSYLIRHRILLALWLLFRK